MSLGGLEDRMALFPGVSARRIVHEFGPWLTDELIATELGQGRLRAWAESGCPNADPEAVLYAGDAGTRERIVAALRRIPPPVLHLAIRHAFFVGIGSDCVGLTSGLALDAGPRVVIAIAGSLSHPTAEDVEGTIAHECAHLFLHTPTSDDIEPASPTPSAFAAAARPRTSEESVARAKSRSRRELQADSLARAWGFRVRSNRRIY